MIKQFRVPGRLALRLGELGVPVAQVLRRAGLPQALFQQVRVLVTTEQLFALWRAIEEVSPDPNLGLKIADEEDTSRFHPMALSALCTANFHAAVEHMARFKKLTAPEEILHRTKGDEWSIWFRWTLAVDSEPQVLIEHCFAWLLTIARHGTRSKITPLRLELMRSRSDRKALEEHFGCSVQFGAPHNMIVFRKRDAEIPFVTQNAELLELLAPQFEQQLMQHRSEDNFVELVRSTIQDRLTGRRPAIEEIASALHLSPRTLQRRLQDSGSNFKRVLDEARHNMARYYLGNSTLELNEAAFLLGYEDPNSFIRAFRTWEGTPPGSWRDQHMALTQ